MSQAASPSLFLVSWFSYLIEMSADFFHKLERLDFQNHFDVSYLRLFTMSIVSNFNFFLLYEIGKWKAEKKKHNQFLSWNPKNSSYRYN